MSLSLFILKILQWQRVYCIAILHTKSELLFAALHAVWLSVGCRFCGAGDYFVRNLTAEEIIFQVEHSILNTGLAGSDIKNYKLCLCLWGNHYLI